MTQALDMSWTPMGKNVVDRCSTATFGLQELRQDQPATRGGNAGIERLAKPSRKL
jgi:hypothetical protein